MANYGAKCFCIEIIIILKKFVDSQLGEEDDPRK